MGVFLMLHPTLGSYPFLVLHVVALSLIFLALPSPALLRHRILTTTLSTVLLFVHHVICCVGGTHTQTHSIEGVHLRDYFGRAQDAGGVSGLLLLHVHQLDGCHSLMMSRQYTHLYAATRWPSHTRCLHHMHRVL